MKRIVFTVLLVAVTGLFVRAQQEEILVREDFSGFTKGSIGNPDSEELAQFSGDYDNRHISSELTKQPGWFGCRIYQAGGSCFMKSSEVGERGAVLATPFNDYSGDLKAKMTIEVPEESESAMIYVAIKYGDFTDCDADKTLFGKEISAGSTEVFTVSTANRTASSEGFIQIFCLGEAYVHEVEVSVTDGGFLGQPVTLQPDFLNDGINFKWQPTRLAEDYRLSLYKMNYTADADIDRTEDFNSLTPELGGIPDGWVFDHDGLTVVSDKLGKDGSKGLTMYSGDKLTLDESTSRYTHCRFWYRVVSSDGTLDKVQGMKLNIEVNDGEKWVKVSDTNLDYVFEYDGGIGEEDIDWMLGGWIDNYYGVRLSVSGPSAKTYLVLDDVEYGYYRPGTLEPVKMNDGKDHITVNGTEFHYADIDPLGEYYYKVEARKGNVYSDGKVNHAFGIPVPDSPQSLDVTENSFVASFAPSAKAMRNYVTLMGVDKITEHDSRFAVADEDFSKIDTSVTECNSYRNPEELGNLTEIALDDYMNAPGWTGRSVALSQGMLGGYYNEGYAPYLKSPIFHFGDSDEYVLTIKAYGSLKDALLLESTTNTVYRLDFNPIENDESYGIHEGSYIVDTLADFDRFTISTNNGWEFLLAEFKIERAVKAGDEYYKFISSDELDGGVSSIAYTNLPGHSGWIWNVRSEYDCEGATASSETSRWIRVDNTTLVESVNNNVTEIERYTIDGLRIGTPTPGINIVRMSDGSVRKIMVGK